MMIFGVTFLQTVARDGGGGGRGEGGGGRVVLCRAVAAYLKVVRRRKTSSADGTRGGEHERGTPPLVRGLGVSPKKFLIF